MTKILILEDDDFIRQQLAGILQEKGYLVVEAASVGQFNNIYEQEEAVIDKRTRKSDNNIFNIV